MTDSQLHMVIKIYFFCSVTLFGVELPQPFRMNIQLRNIHQLTQNFLILQLRHTNFIYTKFKESS